MPFRSKAQVRKCFAMRASGRARGWNCREWADHPPSIKDLPEKASAYQGGNGPMTLEEKTIDAIQAAGAALEKAENFYQEKKAQDQAIADKIPSVVQALATRGMIEENEKDAAARALTDPVAVLEYLKRAAEFVDDDEEQTVLGEQVDASGKVPVRNGRSKRASTVIGSVDSPYVGARTSEKKPSDLAFERALGIG